MNVLDCVFLAISLGNTDNKAPVPPVSVPAILSADVAISTLPATVVLAFGVLPAAMSVHAQLTYCWNTHNAVLYTNIQFAGLGIAASLAVASA